jgi:6-phosphogluconolactonase (cycloisomerase 2 family)
MKLRSTLGLAVATIALLLPAGAQGKGTLFAVGQTNRVGSVAIGPGGSLTPINALTDASTPRSGAVSPDARFLYVSNFGGASVGTYAIAGNGSISSAGAPTPTVPAGQPEGLAITPNGNFLYAANTAANSISGYSRNSETGALTSLGAAFPTGNGPDGIAISSDGAHLYAANENGATISVFNIGADGALTANGAPVPTGTNPNGVAVTPDGRFLYVINTNPANVGIYAINGDGTLSAVTTVPTGGATPFGVAITPDGRFLYTANFGGSNVSGFAIGADGGLTSVGGPFSTGPASQPYWVEAAPDSRQVFAALDVTPGRVSAFNIAAGGALSEIPGSPFDPNVNLMELQSIAITPNQGPAAVFTAVSEGAGQEALFNATSSSDPDGAVARYDWDFGDGTTLQDGGPTPTHVYQEQGNYQVILTVTDDEGCSTQVIFTGQTADCNPNTTTGARVTQTLPVGPGPEPNLNLKLKGKKQELAKKVTVTAKTADETDAVAKGKLKVEPKGRSKKSFTLKKATKSLDANEKTKLKPKLPKKAYKQAKKALKNGGKVTAKVNVKVTDDDADAEKDSVKVKITKP